MYLVSFILALCLVFVEVRAHGHLYDPPMRSSAWRLGYNVPPNYNDMELFCGGRSTQWDTNGGKCGVCGDTYDPNTVGPNEAGGQYATGIITGSYNKGAVIVTHVNLTAYHSGWFEYRLCAINDNSVDPTEDCLNQNLLQIVGNNTNRFVITNLGIGVGFYEVHLQLPATMTCTQCVLQWKYNTGNSWGCDPSNSSNCALGLGPQEQFVNCADIRIVDTSGAAGATSSTTQSTSPTTPSTTQSTSSSTSSTTQSTSPSTPSTTQTTPSTTSQTTSSTASTSTSTTSTTTQATQSETCTGNDQISCSAVGIWKTVSGIPQWCNNNCILGYCPADYCSCTC